MQSIQRSTYGDERAEIPERDFEAPGREVAEPLWRRERLSRKRDKANRTSFGWKTPRPQHAAKVEVTAIAIPGWARKKAVKGLSSGENWVWLKRIAANFLAKLDREAGGSPRLAMVEFRLCKVCKRTLIGAEAERRLELDRQFEGHRTPCGPDCIEVQESRKKPKGTSLCKSALTTPRP